MKKKLKRVYFSFGLCKS